MQVHPVADLFPMLAGDELEELAADIRERGLLQPIVLDAEGRILDGRNRYAACQLAGVEPQFATYDGDDPEGYALAVNIARRHLSKGQIAMVAAKADALTFKMSLRQTAEATKVSREPVRRATVVLQYAPELADLVISGATALNEAYDVARSRKLNAESKQSDMDRLRESAADLADLVQEERMTLAEAFGALDKRRDEERKLRYSTTMNVVNGLKMLKQSTDSANVAKVAQFLDFDTASNQGAPITPLTLREAGAFAFALAEALAAKNDGEREL